MEAVDVHLMLNHVPILGGVVALVLLAAGRWRSDDSLARAGLWALVIVGVVAVAVYLSGEGAEETAETLPGVTEAVIESHEEMAVWALIASLTAGVVALGSLVGYRAERVPRGVVTTALAVALGLSAIAGWTAYLGGQIRHTEIRPDRATPAGSAVPEDEREEAGEEEEGSAARGEATEDGEARRGAERSSLAADTGG